MMRALLITCAVVGVVAVVNAQRGTQGAQTATRTTTAAARPAVPNTYDPNKTQLVDGCLRPASTSGQFQLADATIVKGGNATVGTSGTASKKTYTITGVIPPSVKLQQHLNHKVELSGTILDNGKFEMENLKMLAASCS